MAIDPAEFAAAARSLGLERWPDKGEQINYRLKNGLEGHGRVTLVWMGMEVCIELTSGVHVYPALGDTFTISDVAFEEVAVDGWTGVRAVHTQGQPCNFAGGQCACGRMNLGIVRADPLETP
jgi:hypothetical protein